MPLTVRHLDGPFEGQTQTFSDEIEHIAIGRDPSVCQIVLPPDARMAGREHCSLARVRGRYLIDMNADRRVTLDGHTLLEAGTPLPESCELQIGPEGPRLKLLVTRHSQMASTADQQIDEDEFTRRAARPASEVDVAAVAETAGGSRRIGLMAGVLAIIAAVGGLIFFFVTSQDVEELQTADAEQEEAIGDLAGRADEMEEDLVILGADLPEIMQTAQNSVYLVVIIDSDGGETGIGTAFTVADGDVATNSHVAKWFGQLEDGERMVIRSSAINGAESIDIDITGATHHPGYAAFAELWRDYLPVRLNASKGVDPVRSAGSACDLALLHVDDASQLGSALPLASDAHQGLLLPGHAVAAIGYPMEGMAMEGVNVRQPVPQAQIGRVTSLTTFFNTSEDESESGPGQRNILLQHSIPGTGGASGSPILNGAGAVVGVLSAVNFAIIDGQRIPTSVGVNYAQRATLLEELMDGTADTRLPARIANWDEAVKFLYHSGKLVKGNAGIDALRAIWRRQVQDKVGSDEVVLTHTIAREFYPLTSLEAARGPDGGVAYDITTAITVESGKFYLLMAEADAAITLNLQDDAGLATDVQHIPLGSFAQGLMFQGAGDGTIIGVVSTTEAEHVTWALEEGESVAAVPLNLLRLARSQWRDDLHSRWGAEVRDAGGMSSSGDTVTSDPEGRFYEVEQIDLPTYGRYMIAVIAPDRTNLDLRLYQIDGENRTLLAEDVQQDWYPYLVIDSDYACTLEAEIISDEQNVDYDVYLFRALVAGDTDGDDKVDAGDLVNVALNFGAQSPEDEPVSADIDESGSVGVNDLLKVLDNYSQEWPIEAREQPKRLICMFTIGGSYADGIAHIHPQNFSEAHGWQTIVNNKLSPLVDELGSGAFDFWGHNICGYWLDHDYYWADLDRPEVMSFDQLKFARETIPSLADFTALSSFANINDMQLYGYIGQPRSYERDSTPCGLPFDTNWSHGDLDHFDEYYEEFVAHGFVGLGHDASIHHPSDSPWLNNMVPALGERGIEVFIESLPKRVSPHLLGMNVVAENRVWELFLQHPDIWYTDEEIRAAGGRTVHMITVPLGEVPGEDMSDPDFDLHAWQFERTLDLLNAGETVASPLWGMYIRGYDLQQLVDAAVQSANVTVE
ncbi:MAG: trypsin-like peptidase domain-containing protein [Phycisphaerales bacterium]|nr:trypsin-like peptidase domain-containing protein [Phycisphaerales bacterium]